MQNKSISRITQNRLFWPLVILILITIYNVLFTNGFTKIEIKEGHLYGMIIDIINRASSLMIISMGMTLVVATKGIDISVGSVAAISGAVAASIVGGNVSGVPQHPYWFAVLVALLVSSLMGLWNGLLVSRLGIQPIIATLILLVAGRGIAQLITEGQIITVYYKPYSYLGNGFLLGLPFSIFLALLIFFILTITLKNTAYGLFLQATGINPKASKFVGINIKNIILSVYIISGFCAGVAGLIISSIIKCADSNNAGLNIELDAILSVALGGNSLNGGKFSLAGSLLGALIVQSITTSMYAKGVSPEVLPVVKAIVVVIICIIQSEQTRYFMRSLFAKGGQLSNE
ncbi:ABC transporter permease [Caldicellulosiruptor acetigenus]|uniref:ABC transporter permease n=1 Tax=Caldicellulosiruptor acetigenus TaxID=301953 RepID=UPI0004104A0C|nr:ABC transporter permease [Caldicellulosiruptor acetigenus]WAM36044.1 ABC transporter permease [Caldicellulosiruptor acetigenus]